MDFDFLAFDGPLAQRGIGIIAPFDLALERELWRWVPMEVSLHLARTPYEPVPVSMEMARLVSDSHHLAGATRDVLHVEPEVVAYLCTSGRPSKARASSGEQSISIFIFMGMPLFTSAKASGFVL